MIGGMTSGPKEPRSYWQPNLPTAVIYTPIPFPAVMLIYLMRIVAGLKFFYHTGPVLLQSQSLMHLVGFNGHQVKQGVNRRSLDKSKTAWEDKNNTAIRGPVCPEFIASFIVAIAGKTLERVFNKTISILAANSFFPRKINALLDASDLESTERCEGRGKVTKEKAPELRRRRGKNQKNQGHGVRLQDMGGLGPEQWPSHRHAFCHY